MDKRDMEDVRAEALLLAAAANHAIHCDSNGWVAGGGVADMRQHFAQIALSMGYTITPRKPLPSIATTAGDV